MTAFDLDLRTALSTVLLCAAVLAPERGLAQDAADAKIVMPSFFAGSRFFLPEHETRKEAFREENGERTKVAEMWDRLEYVQVNYRTAYRRVQARESGGEMSYDTVMFSAENLAPMARASHSPTETVLVQFGRNGVRGERMTEDGGTPISRTFNSAFFDSNILDYICVALTSRAPGVYRVPFYSTGSDRLAWYIITVEDITSVEIHGEERRATRVVYRDGDDREAYIWVGADDYAILLEGAEPRPGMRFVAEIVP